MASYFETAPWALSLLGSLVVLAIVTRTLSFVWLYTKPSRLGRYLYRSATGRPPWALVTGASDGIGRALAHKLAARGFNVVIHGRNPAKTEAVYEALRRAYPEREFRKFLFDGDATTAGSLDDVVAEAVDGLHLTVLINNAGASSRPSFGFLWSYSAAQTEATVRLNTLFPTLLTQRLLPQLLAAGPALVIFIGSLSDNCLPLLAAYASSKGFIMQLARVLSRDMAMGGHPVEVIGMRVGEVTGVSNIKEDPAFGLPDATTMAEAVLARVGCGRPVVVGYWQHALQQLGGDLLPGFVMERVFRQVMRKKMREEQTTGK